MEQEIKGMPLIVFLDSQLRRIRRGLEASERRAASAVEIGESGRRPVRTTYHAKHSHRVHAVRDEPAAPRTFAHAAPPELRGKRLRQCACGCGGHVLLDASQDPRVAAFIEGHTPKSAPWSRRKIGALRDAALAARLEQSA